MAAMDSAQSPGRPLAFRKMHGIGNDFVVIDARGRADPVTPALARALGDRHRGVGFDQLAVIAEDPEATARLTFWNADGSTAGACGNATRCVASLLMREGVAAPVLRTENGLLATHAAGDGRITVDMGLARWGWQEIPLAEAVDTLALPLPGSPVAVSMGNPHAVHFVDDLGAVDLATRGPAVETHPLFPERTNVQFVQVLSPSRVQALVWERGVGRTLASGSSACAITVAGHRRGLTERALSVELEGGVLDMRFGEDGHVQMTGPVTDVFEGTLTAAFLAEIAP
ncbi:MAG: diaminopimelate epimerase [Pseudomonadota bacterium]